MNVARIAHRQEHAEPAERCDPIRFLLLHGIEYTDARPWIGFVGAAMTGLIFAVIKWAYL